jgi:hypothetical protein
MKKIYTAPKTLVTGDVTRETMGSNGTSVESGAFIKPLDGAVGFHV